MQGRNSNSKTGRNLTEHEIQDAIRLELSRRGIITFRENVGTFQTEDGRVIKAGPPPGTSDLLAILPGGFAAWIEVKTPTGRVRPEQENFIRRMREKGCRAGIARTVADALAICGIEVTA